MIHERMARHDHANDPSDRLLVSHITDLARPTDFLPVTVSVIFGKSTCGSIDFSSLEPFRIDGNHLAGKTRSWSLLTAWF